MRVSEIAAFLEASFEGDGEHEIRGVSTLESAQPDEIAFVGNAKAVRAAADSRAGCLLVREGFPGGGRPVIFVSDPREAIARLIPLIHPRHAPAAWIHPTAVIAS